jgi:predicted nucleic acid-binding protein
MRVYADTSVLVAFFHPADAFAVAVTRWLQGQEAELLWNPILRAEVRHNLRTRRGDYAAPAWSAYRAAETHHFLSLTRERLSDLLEWADELSAQHAGDAKAGTWDFVHVAAALHSQAEIFATCDEAQAQLAGLAGLEVKLFRA